MHVLIQLHIVYNWFTKINKYSLKFTFNQYMQNEIKNKLRMKAINYEWFKLEEKATRIGLKE